MAETQHARSRKASLLGLVLQAVAAIAAYLLAGLLGSFSLQHLAWLLAGGVPLWFIAVLVFRQRELAALEAMDLDELRREKLAAGAEALFDEREGFLVARTRLEWMERWLVPAFGLIYVAYMLGVGFWSWNGIRRVDANLYFTPLRQVDLGLILHAILMLLLFFYSRYASGLGRLPQWGLLRSTGSFMLGGATVAAAIWFSLGANLYSGVMAWEQWIARIVPWLMMLLGAEALLNFLLDIYRPRTPGAEARACFDSRILGLISEPGGIARSMAEAINYQFGFQVSQTWFYQLLQRWTVPLAGLGAVVLWLMGSVFLVFPHERVIVERFGRQQNADAPLGPGIHVKFPWPIEVAQRYNVDQLREFYVGYKAGYLPDEDEARRAGPNIELWTDPKHAGRDHFNFVIAPPPGDARGSPASAPADSEAESARSARSPVNLIRMHVIVQYRIDPAQLTAYTSHVSDPDAALRHIAWDEVVRFNASAHVDALMGPLRDQVGGALRDRIAQRCAALGLGLQIVHVGMLQVHPERTVAEAFRTVITAQQEKIAEIRRARVKENEVLSRVAGDRERAILLAAAIDNVQAGEERRAPLERALRSLSPGAVESALRSFDELRPLLNERTELAWESRQAEARHRLILEEFELGLGRGVEQILAAEARAKELAQSAAQASERVEAAAAPIRAALAREHGEQAAADAQRYADVRASLEFWYRRLERSLTGLEGDAAVALAEAQARRWQLEMQAAGEVTRLENERFAYAAAPELYKKRRYLEVLVNGLKDARKYLLAFDPGDRRVHIRLETQEQARPGLAETMIEQQ